MFSLKNQLTKDGNPGSWRSSNVVYFLWERDLQGKSCERTHSRRASINGVKRTHRRKTVVFLFHLFFHHFSGFDRLNRTGSIKIKWEAWYHCIKKQSHTHKIVQKLKNFDTIFKMSKKIIRSLWREEPKISRSYDAFRILAEIFQSLRAKKRRKTIIWLDSFTEVKNSLEIYRVWANNTQEMKAKTFYSS